MVNMNVRAIMMGSAAVLILALSSSTVAAFTSDEAAALYREAEATVQKFKAETEGADQIFANAKGVLVCPEIKKIGIGIGYEGGNCVLTDGSAEPVYYSTRALKAGAILGVAKHSMILVFNTDEVLEKFTSRERELEFGVDASVAVAKVGVGGDIDTSNLKKDIVSFIFGEQGLMADLSWEGSRFKLLEEVDELAWWRKAAEPYKGVTIRGVSESTPASQAVADIAAKEFEEITGITVEFEPTSWDEMYSKAINDIQAGSGIYDFIYLEQDIVYTYLAQDWLVSLTELMYNETLVYPDLDLDDFTSFINYFKGLDGHLYGIPFEAFLKTYVYRKDLFEDPEIQQAFQAQYGWTLQPPKDWTQYTQIAKFFTEWGKQKGIELYGHTAQAKTHPCIAYEMSESIWPAWGIWNWGINMDNWKATSANGGTLDSDRAKEALAWYVDMLQYAPPGVKTYTWDETAAAMASGKVAQGLIYGENTAWIATNPARSNVTGKIGVALPPLHHDVEIETAVAFGYTARRTGEGYVGYYDGGAFGIPVSAKNPEAALLFLQFVARKEWAPEFAALAARVVRKSTFNSELVQEMDPKVDGYYSLLRDYGFLFAGAPAFPMHPVLNEIQMKWVVKAVAGEVTAAEACDEMAKEIDATLADLGY